MSAESTEYKVSS